MTYRPQHENPTILSFMTEAELIEYKAINWKVGQLKALLDRCRCSKSILLRGYPERVEGIKIAIAEYQEDRTHIYKRASRRWADAKERERHPRRRYHWHNGCPHAAGL